MYQPLVSTRLVRHGWRTWHWFATPLAVLLAFGATRDGWYEIVETALFDPRARHVWLVPPIILWLVWLRRRRMLTCRPQGEWIGFVCAIAGCTVHEAARHTPAFLAALGATEPNLQALAAAFTVAAAISMILGREVLMGFTPAFAALALLTPLPKLLGVPFGLTYDVWIADAGVVIARSCGVFVDNSAMPFWIGADENRTALNPQRLLFGLSFMLDLLTITYAFVFGLPLHAAARTVLLAMVPVPAFLAGFVGITLAMMFYAWFDPDTAWYLSTGLRWLLLLLSFAFLASLLRLLGRFSIPVRQFSLAYGR